MPEKQSMKTRNSACVCGTMKEEKQRAMQSSLQRNLSLEIAVAIRRKKFSEAKRVLQKALDYQDRKHLRGFLAFVESKLSQDWSTIFEYRRKAAELWKQESTDGKEIPCTVCGNQRAVIMNCPWNGTVCIGCCNSCENEKGNCDYLD